MVLLPPVRRTVRRSRDVAGTVAFVAGAVLGGLTIAVPVAVVAGLTATVPAGARAAVLGVALLSLGLVEAGRVGPRPVGRQRLIPQTRFHASLLRGLFVFGFELGVGFRTRITHMSPFVLLAVLLLADVGLPGFATVAIGWGLGRGSAPLVRLAQRPVVGDLTRGQDEGARSADRFERIVQVGSAWGTHLLFGAAAALAVHGLATI